MFLVVGILSAVWYKVCQSRRGEDQIYKADEGAEPVRLQIGPDAVAEAKRRQLAGGSTTTGSPTKNRAPQHPVYELADEDPITSTSTGGNTAFLEPVDEFHGTSVV
jgi:hypothetical protein